MHEVGSGMNHSPLNRVVLPQSGLGFSGVFSIVLGVVGGVATGILLAMVIILTLEAVWNPQLRNIGQLAQVAAVTLTIPWAFVNAWEGVCFIRARSMSVEVATVGDVGDVTVWAPIILTKPVKLSAGSVRLVTRIEREAWERRYATLAKPGVTPNILIQFHQEMRLPASRFGFYRYKYLKDFAYFRELSSWLPKPNVNYLGICLYSSDPEVDIHRIDEIVQSALGVIRVAPPEPESPILRIIWSLLRF